VITESDYEKPPEQGRTIRIALVLSVLVHLVLALFYVSASGLLSKLHLIPPPKPPDQQVVSISSSRKLEKRPKPKPVPQPVRMTRPPPPPPPQVVQPVPRRVAQVPAGAPPVPSKQRHELSKAAPSAPPEPPRTIKAKEPSDTPTAPASPPPSSPPKQQVALAEHPTPSEKTTKQNPTRSSRMSEQQIAAVERDLSKTIAQAKADTNPLAVSQQQDDGAPKHYAIQMLGAMAKFRGYQGLCDPIKDWEADGYNYYYVACNVAFTDGTLQRQPVPWPVRFKANADPFNGTLRQSQPLSGPLPGWVLPPGTPISKELLLYARQHGANL
jgi:hypothetical protein